MSTTPEQLRLAADIMQNGWEWEWLFNRGKLEWRPPILPANIALYVAQGTKIRRKIVDGKLVKPWSPKFKVGDRVRLTTRPNKVGVVTDNENGYRTIPVSVKWSEDYRSKEMEECLELAPLTLTNHLPGFRPLREGEEWHRQDWSEEMLPEGWRPLLRGEPAKLDDDECYGGPGLYWRAVAGLAGKTTAQMYEDDNWFIRTRRPLPEPVRMVPLEPADWMKDGPWWITEHDKKFISLVLGTSPDFIWTNGGNKFHEEVMSRIRSNDGINWTACQKPA